MKGPDCDYAKRNISVVNCETDSFDCSHYSNIRHTLFQNLNWLPNYCALDLTLLTCGNPTLPYEQNEIIFKHVFEYIKRSERFLIV